MNFFFCLMMVFSLCFSLTSHSVLSQDSKIYWSDSTKLDWDDYQGTPNGEAYEAVMTICKIEIEYHGKYLGDSLVITVDTRAAFLPEKSWVKKAAATKLLLEHEQLHLDIAELFARKMRKAFIEANFTKENYKEKIKNIYQQYKKDMATFRNKYADDTFYGARNVEQTKWALQITKALDEWKEFGYHVQQELTEEH